MLLCEIIPVDQLWIFKFPLQIMISIVKYACAWSMPIVISMATTPTATISHLHSANLSLPLEQFCFQTVATASYHFHSGWRNMAASKQFIQVALMLMIVLSTSGDEDATTETLPSFTGETEAPTNTSDFMICAEVSIRSHITSENSPTIIRVLYIITFVPISIASITLNSFVMFLVAKYKKLHTLSFAVALQIMAVDIVFTISFVLPVVATASVDSWPFGNHACVVSGYVTFTAAITRLFLMFVFVIDRFLSVFTPYFYPRHSIKIIVTLSVASWVLIIAAHAIVLPGALDCYTFVEPLNACVVSASCSQHCMIFLNMHLAILGLLPMLVPSILYCALYCKARALRRETVVPTNPGSGPTNDAALKENRKRELRATVTFFLLFITILPAVAPTSIVNVVVDSVTSASYVSLSLRAVRAVSAAFLCLLLISDPIVIMRNQDVREVLLKFKRDIQKKLCQKQS